MTDEIKEIVWKNYHIYAKDANFQKSLQVLQMVIEENEKLKQQIEQMKCCLNCKHLNVQHNLCVYSMGDKKYNCKLRQWELA